MITKEVNEWMRKARNGVYSNEDVMSEFVRISRYLTRDEMEFVKSRLAENDSRFY